MLTAEVFVRPKRGILDPQGKAVHHALETLGFADVRDVRVGRYVVLQLDGDDVAAADGRVRDMCDRLLANGVIEDYEVRVTPAV